jgi:hypothetical protein
VKALVAAEVEVAVDFAVFDEVDKTIGQVSTLTIFVSKVTAAPRANTPPFETAAVFIVTEAAARIFPAR